MTEQFDVTSTTDDVLKGISLTGKVALVTGASGGLGAETARAFAAKDATVILASRDIDKTQAKATEIQAQTGNRKIHTLVLDLADLNSVRAAADKVLSEFPQIHLLIDNAGVMACELGRTDTGCDLQFGTNHIGHFLFTCLLAPALIAADKARVVVLSSGGHKYCDIHFDDLKWEKRDYDKWLAYGQAKTANALFALELNRRLQPSGVLAFSVHPGVIFTELARHLTEQDIEAIISGSQRGKLEIKSIECGAATSVWAATAEALEDHGGAYLEDCQLATQVEADVIESGYYAYLANPDSAKRLWEASERIVGQHFDF